MLYCVLHHTKITDANLQMAAEITPVVEVKRTANVDSRACLTTQANTGSR